MEPFSKKNSVHRFENGSLAAADDWVAIEEPLEIRVVFGDSENRKNRSLSITMRTPGHDHELAAGFLLGEGIIQSDRDILQFEETGSVAEGSDRTNQLCVHLREGLPFDFASLQRNFYTTSSCGICGKASLEAVRAHLPESLQSEFKIAATTVLKVPAGLREQQATFEKTGGLHAAGLFDTDGKIQSVFEDVGRHNALDKLIGHRVIVGSVPLADCGIVVSGRASFELIQKTIAAGVGMLVAVGAPSSLAVDLAEEFGVCLIGFASESRFNVYSHRRRCDGL